MLKRIQQFFLPLDITYDPLEKRRTILLVNVTLITTLFTLFYLGSTIAFDMPSVKKLMISCAILFFSFAWLIKFNISRSIVANLYVLSSIGASFGVIYFSDGLYSFDIPWLALGPICAILLNTGVNKWIWLLLSSAVVVYFGLEELSGKNFPMEMSEKFKPAMYIFANVGLIFILFFIIRVLDRTSESSLEKMIGLNQKLSREKKKSDDLVKIRDRFFSIISHDLRGPIGSFKGLTFVIKNYIEEKRHEDLVTLVMEMERSIENVSDLLDNLLNWASQQEGQIPYRPAVSNLFQIVRESIENFELMAASKAIELKANIDKSILVFADENTTATIFRNLVNNALKFTLPGGKITVSAQKTGDLVDVFIADTGVGIEENKLKNLFELKPLRSTYGTNDEKGVGLGLQIVSEFVKLNKGFIKVESKLNEGTTFIISLPANEILETEIPKTDIHL